MERKSWAQRLLFSKRLFWHLLLEVSLSFGPSLTPRIFFFRLKGRIPIKFMQSVMSGNFTILSISSSWFSEGPTLTSSSQGFIFLSTKMSKPYYSKQFDL